MIFLQMPNKARCFVVAGRALNMIFNPFDVQFNSTIPTSYLKLKLNSKPLTANN